jgi:hypothetical protein
MCASSASRPAAAARVCASPAGAIPAYQSRPSAPWGARPDAHTAQRTPSGSSAAQASACGLPPEWPITANRSMPSAPAMLATSAAAEATSRPGRGVDVP